MRNARTDKGLTFSELGARLGRATSTVCAWETENRTPSYADALAIERVLGVSIDLWGYDRATGLHADDHKARAAAEVST